MECNINPKFEVIRIYENPVTLTEEITMSDLEKLPALTQAYLYQQQVVTPQLDWQNIEQVLADVQEEIRELREAETIEEKMSELGDLLFVIVNWGRWAGVTDSEAALQAANQRFARRLQYIQQTVAQSGKPFTDWTTAELTHLWDEAKSKVG
jgi:tetrapyrrole methylase family protein / MazG family protein